RQPSSRSCVAGAVETDDQNARVTLETKRLRISAKQRGQFVVKNFDDLLTGYNATKDTFAERFLFYPGDEFSGDLKIDVRFKQRHAHLAQRSVDVRLTDNAVPAEVLENVLKLIAELRKHE